MNKHRSHQIDDLAQRVFAAALLPTWTRNEHKYDYGKDYLVEIGDDDGEQTGLNFFVQLKGQEKVELTADGKQVTFTLETKHATYYVDRIKDLPVFLVVVDVNKGKAWYHFLQPGLLRDQSWRRQKSVTVRLFADNDLSDSGKLRQAVENAKKMMRWMHPESIYDAVKAHTDQVRAVDPRFDVQLSLVNGKPMFDLRPTEPVSGTIQFKRGKKIDKKVNDLLGKGVLVDFAPGEVKFTGTKLLEPFEKVGGALQLALQATGSLTLICLNEDGRELERLPDVPGLFTGGMSELWFAGGLENSPFSVKVGPITPDTGGSIQPHLRLANWEGQRLLQLAYFDRLYPFLVAAAATKQIEVQGMHQGNVLFVARGSPGTIPFASPLAKYIAVLQKARKVAERFGVKPIWTFKGFDEGTMENADKLYSIFFEEGWRQPIPNATITLKITKKTFRPEVLRQTGGRSWLKLASNIVFFFLGEKIDAGHIVQEFSDMELKVQKGAVKARVKKRDTNAVPLVATGSGKSVMTMRRATAADGPLNDLLHASL